MFSCLLQPSKTMLRYAYLSRRLLAMHRQARLDQSAASRKPTVAGGPMQTDTDAVVDLTGIDDEESSSPSGVEIVKATIQTAAEKIASAAAAAVRATVRAARRATRDAEAAVAVLKRKQPEVPPPTGRFFSIQATLTSVGGRCCVVPCRTIAERLIRGVHERCRWVKFVDLCLENTQQPAKAPPPGQEDVIGILPHPHALVVRLPMILLTLLPSLP